MKTKRLIIICCLMAVSALVAFAQETTDPEPETVPFEVREYAHIHLSKTFVTLPNEGRVVRVVPVQNDEGELSFRVVEEELPTIYAELSEDGETLTVTVPETVTQVILNDEKGSTGP